MGDCCLIWIFLQKACLLYPVAFLLQPDELTSLLVVMLYDLQDRKFQAREIFDEEEPVAEVRKTERYLYKYTC